MLHSVHDINSARLNTVIPTLQRTEEDSAFLEHQRHRFDQDEPPPPYSSHSTTRLPTPDPFVPTADDIALDELLREPLSDYEINVINGRFRGYYPYDRYVAEVRQEKGRIDRAYSRRDANYVSLYRGPDLIGRAGRQRELIMARHSIKKRWQQLGVWNPDWGVPTNGLGYFGNGDGPEFWSWEPKPQVIERKYNYLPREEKMASWPSQDEETPNERAIRLYLKREGRWSETLKVQPSGTGHSADIAVDEHESLITSRPWFVWALEVVEEEVRLRRNPKSSEIRDPAAADNVRARWKEKAYWKDSWDDSPGWKWRHESPSPEPPDPNDMEFTPSEIDALERIPPPTPPSPPAPWTFRRRSPTWSKIFGFLPGYEPDPAPPTSVQPTSKPHGDGNGDHEGNRLGAIAGPSGGESAQLFLENDAYVAPRTEMTRPETGTSCSTVRVEIPFPVVRNNLFEQQAPGSSKISKPTQPTRRSARIAERERRVKNARALSETVKAIDKKAVTSQPLKELSQQMRGTLTRATRRKKDHTHERHLPGSSKPQGITKRRGRPRRLNA